MCMYIYIYIYIVYRARTCAPRTAPCADTSACTRLPNSCEQRGRSQGRVPTAASCQELVSCPRVATQACRSAVHFSTQRFRARARRVLVRTSACANVWKMAYDM